MKRMTMMWMLAAILCCGLTTVLTACSTNDDNPAGTVTTALEGQWISYEDKSGTFGDEEWPYDQIARVLQFDAGGTGFYELYYLLEGEMVSGEIDRYDGGVISYTTAGERLNWRLTEGTTSGSAATTSGKTATACTSWRATPATCTTRASPRA